MGQDFPRRITGYDKYKLHTVFGQVPPNNFIELNVSDGPGEILYLNLVTWGGGADNFDNAYIIIIVDDENLGSYLLKDWLGLRLNQTFSGIYSSSIIYDLSLGYYQMKIRIPYRYNIKIRLLNTTSVILSITILAHYHIGS